MAHKTWEIELDGVQHTVPNKYCRKFIVPIYLYKIFNETCN